MQKNKYGYLVWFLATLFVVYSLCLNTAAAVFSEAVKATLIANNFETNLGIGSFIIGFALMQIPAGYLIDKFNIRYTISLGVFLLATGNAALSLSHHLLSFSLSNFLQGIGASFAFIAAAVLIGRWFETKKFPIMFGLTQTLSCVCSGILHYYFIVLLTTQSWSQIYQKIAIAGFILFILTFLLVRDPKEFHKKKSISFKKSIASVFKNKQILLISLAAATSFGILLSYASFWYKPVQSFHYVKNLQAAIISSIIFLGLGLGTPFWGWISNLIESRMKIIHLTLSLGTMFLLMGLYLPHFETHIFIIIEIISFLIGFFLSGSMLFYTVVNEISEPSYRGISISVINSSVFLFNSSMMFIPYLLITKHSTEFFTYLWILPFFILFSIFLLYFIHESHPPR